MSTFDIRQDAPGLLRQEALNITLTFTRTGPTTGRVSWNIPTPAAGCTAENQAYCGMLVTIDSQPATADKTPKAGTVYSADPTASPTLFAGDKLGTAMIIGAFYEDRTTTFFDVTDLTPNTPYFVSGFPMDCQYRYFIEGVHAYSTEFTNRGSDGTTGQQAAILRPNTTPGGVKPTDFTGLMNGIQYDFSIQLGIEPALERPLNSLDCKLDTPKYTIDIDGAFAQTYADLVNEINKKLAQLKNCPISPLPPNAGGYYWNDATHQLFQWDGFNHVAVPVIYQTTPPNVIVAGTYWYNPETKVLRKFDGVTWTVVSQIITFPSDPSVPLPDKSYWFDGTTAYVWNGNTWCQIVTFVQETDPSLAAVPAGGSYWYDEDNGMLYKWDSVLEMWTLTDAVQSDFDPNALPLGSYWFNQTLQKLYASGTPNPGWNEQANVAISELAPAVPAPGKFWYKPTTEELFQRNIANTAWTQLDVIAFPKDPTIRAYCDLWWNTMTDVLNVWDAIHNVWVPVSHFYQQSNDPAGDPVIADGSAWYQPSTGILSIWANGCWKPVDFINYATDPNTSIADGVVWHNLVTNKWYVRSAGAWFEVAPIYTTQDPTMIASGSFWFKPGAPLPGSLYMWNGAAWVTVSYSQSPYTPSKHACWYNSTTDQLMEWNGVAYVPAQPIATVELDCNGNLLFTDTNVGSTSFVRLMNGTLFSSLTDTWMFSDPSPGSDGASDVPSYAELGVGTDGTDNIRNSILNDIRYELGYPVIDVELTQQQMDYAINRALQELRARSSIAYKRGFFFMSIKQNEQKFFLTNKISGQNKIVDIMGIYRLTSSFLSSAHGAGVYGQIVLQHMYNMGTFDLLSFHLQAEYSSLLEILFAARIAFSWNEQTRQLHIHHKFPFNERMVCVEATVERTEQDIMSDRYVAAWIRKYVGGLARIMLAEVRGKFSTLPGASGSVTLNATDLRTAGQTMIEECMSDIEDFITDKPDEYGMGSQFVFG